MSHSLMDLGIRVVLMLVYLRVKARSYTLTVLSTKVNGVSVIAMGRVI